MCCDGTLFNYVTLNSDDLPRLTKYPHLKIELRSQQESFGEPCILHTGKGCSAYDDRPDTCRRYVCEVLRSANREELTEDEAVGLIREARALVENVKEYVEFEPGAPLAVSTWEAPPPDISEEARLAWERTMHHLNKHFLGTVQEPVA
jgi:Fe-S-cluster containining protein